MSDALDPSPDLEPPADVEPIFTATEIRDAVGELGRRLREERDAESPLLLSLLGGSVIFLADLVRAYGHPLRYEFVHVGYRHPEVSASDVLQIQYPIPVDVEDQELLVVKDVVTSGVTETYLGQQFLQRGARTVRFVALVDMPEERKTDLEVDYRAFSMRRAGPLVGYGLKHRGLYGNLPGIGRLVDEEP